MAAFELQQYKHMVYWTLSICLFATKSFQQEDKTPTRSSQGIVKKHNSVNKIKQVVGYNHYLY